MIVTATVGTRGPGRPLATRAAWLLTSAIACLAPTAAPAAAGRPPVPDLTRGQPRGDDVEWTLGPTGLRGWTWNWRHHTTDARQILVTTVAAGSPADGVLEAGDVIVGLDGGPFTSDARLAFARAVTEAERESGRLALVRWRKGGTEDITLRIPVLGSYSATAPYDCEKSRRILEAGCAAIAERGFTGPRGGIQVTIPNDLRALALLAGGTPGQRPLVAEYARAVARHRPGGHVSWGYAYETLFLAEYVLATDDRSVLPGLERLALDIARGQSGVGTWGHAFARATDRRLNGYGCMNQPGIVLTLAMVLAREAGVSSPDLDAAIETSERFLRWYVGKGAIPYGDHAPWPDHEDNGKCSSVAVLFDLLGRREGAGFFARMATAAHAERESGHTGNFFNVLWALPGVSRLGPAATGAYLRETAWYYDLARGWDGRFVHQVIPGVPDKDQYGGWDTTGAMMLSYALPLKRLAITGRRPSVVPPLAKAELDRTIADGRWNFWDGLAAEYEPRPTAALVAGLSSWSPTVRERSAKALATKADAPVATVAALLDSRTPEARWGGCAAVKHLGPRADAAAPKLRGLLGSADPWDRVMAATALVELSDAERNAALVDLLEVVLRKGDAEDPRRCVLGPLAEVLFKPAPGKREPRSILGTSLDAVGPPHRPLLVAAIREVMHAEDGRIRGGAAATYGRLSRAELAELMPDIIETIRTPAPSGEMFAYDIRMRGLEVLAQHRIREGMDLAVQILNEDRWGRDFNRAARALAAYGGAARHLVPTLRGETRAIAAKATGKDWAATLDRVIRTIEDDRQPKPVQDADDFIAANRPPAGKTPARTKGGT